MARKRLTPLARPAVSEAAATPVMPDAMPGAASRTTHAHHPPIARVAGESAAEAALATLSAEVAQARAEGRLIVALPLEKIDESHLVRDRVEVDEAEMTVLMTSLTERGQQTAIEVIDLHSDGAAGQGARYGLISGWRRLLALRRLHHQTGEARFATVKALVRQPEAASDAYCAMVDENEIRVGLSYWERARIAVQAAEAGIYPTPQKALRDLFAAASRAKRSKIGSFVGIYTQLGEDGLRFPTALPERLGLALAKVLEEDTEAAADIAARLEKARPADAAAEQALLAAVLAERTARGKSGGAGAVPPAGSQELQARALAGVRLTRAAPDRLELAGPGVDSALEAALAKWLKARRSRS